jgi:hypothetical protein
MFQDFDAESDFPGPPTVEFVGGPYDGFLHVLSEDVSELAGEIAVPVSFNLILAACGDEHGPLLPFRRLAAYELSARGNERRYVFSGEIVVEQADHAR